MAVSAQSGIRSGKTGTRRYHSAGSRFLINKRVIHPLDPASKRGSCHHRTYGSAAPERGGTRGIRKRPIFMLIPTVFRLSRQPNPRPQNLDNDNLSQESLTRYRLSRSVLWLGSRSLGREGMTRYRLSWRFLWLDSPSLWRVGVPGPVEQGWGDRRGPGGELPAKVSTDSLTVLIRADAFSSCSRLWQACPGLYG